MKLFIAVFFTGLITLPAWAGVNNAVSVEIVNQPSMAWRFTNVNTHANNKRVLVRGYITADDTFGLPKGHVDIAAYSPRGELISVTTPKYFPRYLMYRDGQRGKVRFSTQFAEVLPPNSIIKIAFHSTNQSVKESSAHHNTAVQ